MSQEILLYLTFIAGLIPAILIIVYRKKLKYKEIYYCAPFLWLTFIASIYEPLFSLKLKWDVAIWFKLYGLFEFVSLFYFFYHILQPKYKLLTKVFLCVFLLLFVISNIVIDFQQIFESLAIINFITFSFVVTCSFIWLRDSLRRLEIPYLWKHPSFYFVGAFLIYYSSTFFLFLLSDLLLKNYQDNFIEFWFLNIISTFIFRILLITGVWNGKLE